jgi:hypothetical protein
MHITQYLKHYRQRTQIAQTTNCPIDINEQTRWPTTKHGAFDVTDEHGKNCPTPEQENNSINKTVSNITYAGYNKLKHEPHLTA